MISGNYRFNLDGKKSIALGIDAVQLPQSNQVKNNQNLLFAAFSYHQTLICPAIRFQYQHYSSDAEVILGLEPALYPLNQGLGVKGLLSIPKWHWIRLEIGYSSVLATQTQYDFMPTSLQASQSSSEIRYNFFSTGLSISKSF